MIKILTLDDIIHLIHQVGLDNFFIQLIDEMREDFARWPDFHKTPRHATHFPHGVIEVMPISNTDFYTFKYVNGHPYNPEEGKLNVVALGLLAEVSSGYPLMISEMTLLTALRTAAASSLASSFLARRNSSCISIIGTGSQGEFQVLAHHFALGIEQVKYYDRDPHAMRKFADNMTAYPIELIPCHNTESAIAGADIITTATAAKATTQILADEWIEPGTHINAIGGDCPGKTELDPKILLRSKIVVENLQQTQAEGEIQHIDPNKIYAELWEIIAGHKPGRETDNELTVFDSVGFALEDYSTLKYVYQLAEQYQLGQELHLIPELADPKDLFRLIKKNDSA